MRKKDGVKKKKKMPFAGFEMKMFAYRRPRPVNMDKGGAFFGTFWDKLYKPN